MGKLTKKQWQIRENIDDELMARIDLVYKLFHGQEVTIIDISTKPQSPSQGNEPNSSKE